jgi:hypothetical protein
VTAGKTDAVSRALGAVARKVGVPEEDIALRLRARDRMTWSRFRFELAREISTALTGRFSQVRSVYLWELDEENPEAPEAPAEPTLDIILRVDRIPVGLDELALDIGKDLARDLRDHAPGTPLVVNVHVLTRPMITAGRGMAALFRSTHQRPALVWSASEQVS